MRALVDTRSRLLEAAIAVIEAEGEVAVRVRDVAADVGVTYASLYHFFGSREGLIEAAQVERYRRSLLEPIGPLRDAVAGCRTKREFRSVIRDAMLGVYQPERARYRMARINVLGSGQSRPHLVGLIADAQHQYNTEVADILRGVQEKGWVRGDVDLAMLAAWVQGQTNGRLLIEIDPERSDAAAWNRISIEAILAVLMGDPPRRGGVGR